MSNENEDTSRDTSGFNRRLMGNVVRLPVHITTGAGTRLRNGFGAMQPHHDPAIFLDFWGDEGVCSLGYNSDEFKEAVSSFMRKQIPHQLPDVYPHSARFDAAELICDRTGMDRIFFANSGTEANEAMIKIARRHWWLKEGSPMTRTDPRTKSMPARRHVIATIAGNFHGRTGLSMAACDPRVSPYHRFGYEPMAQGFVVVDLIDGVFQQVVTDGYPHDPRPPKWDTIAAITMAPVLGNNLVMTYPPDFWRALQAVREETGTLIMLDDVQAGNGRAGYYSTWQHPDIIDTLGRPDVICLGKGMALGFPMSAMLASEEVAEAFSTPGVHFNTFGGSPWVCHMAEFYYRWLDENLEGTRTMGAYIRSEFQAMPWVKSVDGSGMLNAFLPDYQAHGYNGFDLCHKSREMGLSIVTHRPLGPIRFTPPMNVSGSDLAEAFDILNDAHAALVADVANRTTAEQE